MTFKFSSLLVGAHLGSCASSLHADCIRRVWLARKRQTGDLYAIKVLKKAAIMKKNMADSAVHILCWFTVGSLSCSSLSVILWQPYRRPIL